MRFKDRYKKQKSFHLPSIDLSIIAAMFLLIFAAWGVAKMERSNVKIDKIVPVFTISKEITIVPVVEKQEKKDAVKIGEFLSLGRAPKKPIEKAAQLSIKNDHILRNIIPAEKTAASQKLRFPKIVYQSMPDYPVKAIEESKEGLAIINAFILKNGRVGNAVISLSSGHDILDKAAVSAISQWIFEPAAYGRETTEFYFKIPIRFRLSAN